MKSGGAETEVATVASALRWGVGVLRRTGVGEPTLDAEVLLANRLGVDRACLLADGDQPFDGDGLETFRRQAEWANAIARDLSTDDLKRTAQLLAALKGRVERHFS